jgi:HAD superfamily hydrolase (TIGR01490 family)
MARARRQDDEAASASPSLPSPEARRAMLSVFDLDRTLTILPTYTPFLWFAVRNRAPWRMLLLPLLLPVAALYALKLISRRQMKQAMHWAALGSGISEREAARLADRFAQRLVARGLYAKGVALMEAERKAGRRIILATAAPHFYTAALARRLGIADVVATASSWRDGRLMPAIGSPNCYGADKRALVEAFMERSGIARETAHIRFYSDHQSDLPMFELADEAIAVNPSTNMRGIAATRGWPVLDWRR